MSHGHDCLTTNMRNSVKQMRNLDLKNSFMTNRNDCEIFSFQFIGKQITHKMSHLLTNTLRLIREGDVTRALPVRCIVASIL